VAAPYLVEHGDRPQPGHGFRQGSRQRRGFLAGLGGCW
jgi:hypothetical protein